MPTRIVALILALACAASASAQDAVPTIRAHSKVVTIIDGLHVKKNYWYVMPEKSPEVYYVEIPRQPHTVTFTTDVESISFPVTFGSTHEFVIKLDDGVETRTQIRAVYRKPVTYARSGPASANGVDTVPFTLGDNDKIYVKGRVNGGPPLDFQFDLGAGGSLMKKGSVPKVQMTFDGTITLHNSDGSNVVPTSSANRLEIAGLGWDNVSFAVVDNMTHREDGLLGNALFQDKVVEIDYDRMVMSIHDERPALSSAWKREDMLLDGGTVPFVRGTLSVGGAARPGWFMLDTGASTSILNSDRLSVASKFTGELRGLLGPLGGGGPGVAVSIGGRTFTGINYSVRNYDGDPAALGLAGNDVLKRLNVLIDNRGGFAYFRPNARGQDSFRNPERVLVRVAAALAAAIGVWLVARRMR